MNTRIPRTPAYAVRHADGTETRHLVNPGPAAPVDDLAPLALAQEQDARCTNCPGSYRHEAVAVCSLTFPVSAEMALEWAKSAQWFFASYYKFGFTFEAYCTVAFSDDLVAHQAKAIAITGGDAGDIYKFNVTSGPMDWDELSQVGTPDLSIRDGEVELVRTY